MRSQKFRAWSKKHKKYLKITGIQFDGDKVAGVFVVFGTIAGIPNIIFLESEDIILEQYIGLKDKNGKEICDGDILDDGEKHIGKVLYNERLASFAYEWGYCGSTFMNLYTSDMKVIGNIHENAELLKEEK